MKQLSEPTKELSLCILEEVSFDDRIMGFKFRERTGPMSVPLYSFKEVVYFLNDSFPRVDFAILETWIRNIMKESLKSFRAFRTGSQKVRESACLS